MPRPSANRPLTDREREVLTFLLDFDPGHAMREGHRALVRQIDFVRVTEGCECGCASVMFGVDRDRAPRASGYDGHLLVCEARHISEPRQVMVFAEDGWLNQIEIVDYDEEPQRPPVYAVASSLESHGDQSYWTPTVLFYAAVQIVEAVRADHFEHKAGHEYRMSDARHYAQDARAAASYQSLRSLSSDWRYDGKRPTVDDIATAWSLVDELANSLAETWPPA